MNTNKPLKFLHKDRSLSSGITNPRSVYFSRYELAESFKLLLKTKQ